MFRVGIGLVFGDQGESRADQRVGYHQLIISALKIADIFQPAHEPRLQLDIVIEQIKAVGEPEVTSDHSDDEAVPHHAGRMIVGSLIATVGVVPLHDRVALAEGLGDFGVAPGRIEDAADIVVEKIGKGFPAGRLVVRLADGDELAVAELGREDRAAEPLLTSPDEFLCLAPIGGRGK